MIQSSKVTINIFTPEWVLESKNLFYGLERKDEEPEVEDTHQGENFNTQQLNEIEIVPGIFISVDILENTMIIEGSGQFDDDVKLQKSQPDPSQNPTKDLALAMRKLRIELDRKLKEKRESQEQDFIVKKFM